MVCLQNFGVCPALHRDDGSDIDDVYEDAGIDVDTEAKEQVNGELEDKLDENGDLAPSQAKDDDSDQATKAKAHGDDAEDEDEEDEDGEEYNVESIQDHKWVKGQLLYFIKWQGYPASQNTWEPEEHLLPYDRDPYRQARQD
ncbi:hypothetical protein CLCR_11418 [Cladophialophora carrionii]|uniref:Chromo domain-containing protein n=1 Tax=Cladophialophora carrionii TaxID=86049 RepID=A0A1C1CYZ6_9EURO|nr:hypothetical protein CLCR_11418 [Cladophialophora carrionii]